MKKFTIYLVVLIGLFITSPTFAAQKDIESYSTELASYDVVIKQPESFRNLDMRQRIMLNYNMYGSTSANIGDIYNVGLESDNQQAVLLYPEQHLEFVGPRVKSSTDAERILRQNLKNDSLDVRPLVNIITQEDMSQYSNADTVMIYEFDFQNPFLSHYNHCAGVYMRKYGHPALNFMIALDDAGYRNKTYYIEVLFENVRYGNARVEKMIEIEARDAAIKDFDFPSKPLLHPRGGIILNDVETALNRVWNQGGYEAFRDLMDYYSSDEYKQSRQKRENENNAK